MKKSIEIFIEGEHFISLGLLTLAREKFLEALEINKKNRDEEGIGVCLIYLAQIATKENKKTEALEYLEKAREHYRNRNMDKMLAQLELIQNEIDTIQEQPVQQAPVDKPKETKIDPFQLFRDGEIEAAGKIFEADVSKFRRSGKQRELGMSLLYAGQCKFTAGNHSDALTNLNEALKIGQNIRDQELIQAVETVFANIALIEKQKDLDMLSVQELTQQNFAPSKLIMMLLSKAEISILKGLGKEAEAAIHEARKLLPKLNLEKYLVLIMIVESKLLRFYGKNEAAKKLLEQTKEIAGKLNESNLTNLVENSINES